MNKGMNVEKLKEFLSGGRPVEDKGCECGCQDSAACEAGIAAPAAALTDAGGVSSQKNRAGAKAKKRYLDIVATEDAGLTPLQEATFRGWKNPVNPIFARTSMPKATTPVGYPFKEKSLEEHDNRWHKGHYTGGACKYRKDNGIPTWKEGEGPGEKADQQAAEEAERKALSEFTVPHADFDGEAIESNAREVGELVESLAARGTTAWGDKLTQEKQLPPLWEGEISDKSDEEISDIAEILFAALGEDIYNAIGEDGIVSRQYGRTIRDVPAEELDLEDSIKEDIAEALPEKAQDLNYDELVKTVAGKANKFVSELLTWEDLEGKGEEYEDDVD